MKVWDDESIETLTKLYTTTKVKDLVEILPFTDTQIRKKAKLLGLTKSESGYQFNKWNKEDEELLANNYNDSTVTELIEILNNKFTEQQIRNKIHRMGLSKTNKWTVELEEYLLNNYTIKTILEMKEDKLFQFTEIAIYKKLNKLGIKISNNIYWTNEEELLMKNFYHLRTNNEMQELLPRFTINQIQEKARNMRLKKLPLVVYKAKSTCNKPDMWTDEERSILIDYYGKIPNKKIKNEYLPSRSLNSIKKQANKLLLSDNLRFKFHWEAVDSIYKQEEPNSITIIIKKRRLDLC